MCCQQQNIPQSAESTAEVVTCDYRVPLCHSTFTCCVICNNVGIDEVFKAVDMNRMVGSLVGNTYGCRKCLRKCVAAERDQLQHSVKNKNWTVFVLYFQDFCYGVMAVNIVYSVKQNSSVLFHFVLHACLYFTWLIFMLDLSVTLGMYLVLIVFGRYVSFLVWLTCKTRIKIVTIRGPMFSYSCC